jgi:hypothetical protein
LASGAGGLLAVEVGVEVVVVEAFVAAVLVGGVTRQRSADGDPVFSLSVSQADQAGAAAVGQVLGGQQAAASRAGVDAGQGLGIVGGGRGSGHVRDHIHAAGGAGLGRMGENPFPRALCPRRA